MATSERKYCSEACEATAFEQTRLWVPRGGRPSVLVDFDRLKRELVSDIRAEVSKPLRGSKAKPIRDGLLNLLAPVDLHIGKLAWAPETGEDYDSKIAIDRLQFAVDALLDRASGFPIARHLFVVGNDLLQVDNAFAMTTAGTFQDQDSRYRKQFRNAVSVMTWAIKRQAETAPVDVLIVPGNHDQLASFGIGEVLAARFENSDTVHVSHDLSPRLYYRFGQNLLGFTHGNEEKQADLPLIMATERKADWSETLFHDWFLGHFHAKKEMRFTAGDSINGVSVRILPSLTGTDAWHAKRGYVGQHRRSESYLFHPQDGCVASFTATVKLGVVA